MPIDERSSILRQLASSPLIYFLGKNVLRAIQSLGEHRRAFFSSLSFRPPLSQDIQFVRYVPYQLVGQWARAQAPGASVKKIVEFGGSNGIIRNMLPGSDYQVAPNYPEVDVQELKQYGTSSYDIVVIDNIIEHVQQPARAVEKIRRILKPGGHCICITPFLIRIHNYPADYWRFTEKGLQALFKDYQAVEINGWGNRYTLQTTSYFGWLTLGQTRKLMRVAMWNEDDWPIVYLTIATK